MNPLLVNLAAESRHHERIAALRRSDARARRLFTMGNAGSIVPGSAGAAVRMNDVRPPDWWDALESADLQLVPGDGRRDTADVNSDTAAGCANC